MAYPQYYVQITTAIGSPQRAKFYNIFWYIPDAEPAGNPQQKAADLATKAMAKLSAHLATVLTTQDTEMRCLASFHAGGVIWDSTVSQLVMGTADSDQQPDFVAVCIQKRTAVPGKSGRGRWFLGPVPEDFTDENHLTNSAIVDYGHVADDWMGSFADAADITWTPCLNSRKDSVLLPLIAVEVDRDLASQRGRKFQPI